MYKKCLDKGSNAAVSDESEPPRQSRLGTAGKYAMQGKNCGPIVTPIQHLSIMNYICARKCEKLAHADDDDTKIMAGLTCNPNPCPPMPSYAVPVFHQCSRMSNEDILIYPFSGPDYRYDGGSIYARKMAAKAARPAMAIELPVVLAAPLKAWMGELVGLGTALENVLMDCQYCKWNA